MRLPVPGPTARKRITRLMWVAAALVLLGVFQVWALATSRGGNLWGAAIGLAAAALVVYAFVVRPSRRRGGLVSPAVQTATTVRRPVAVPGSVEGPVRACMRCGSRDLAMPGLRDGVWLGGGELQFVVCRNCNSRAPALEFERGEDYVAFVKELAEVNRGPGNGG